MLCTAFSRVTQTPRPRHETLTILHLGDGNTGREQDTKPYMPPWRDALLDDLRCGHDLAYPQPHRHGYATTDGRVYRVCNNSTTMQQFNTHVYHPDWFPFIRRNFKQAYQRGERHTDRDMDTENEREEVHARGVSGLGAAGSTRKRRILRRE